MILSFHPCFEADEQIILGNRLPAEEELRLIGKAKAVILPQGRPVEQLHEACLSSGALLFPDYRLRFKYPGKMGQSLLFRSLGLPYPETRRWLTLEELTNACDRFERLPHELPFMIKADRGHEAEGVYLVEDRDSLINALEQLAHKQGTGQSGFITQAYVPSNGNVLRAVIIGKRIITYWKRPALAGQVITSISKGAIIDHHWRPDLQEKGKRQAIELSKKTGVNLAAVDFVFPFGAEDPEPLFLEINYYFARRGLGGNERYYRLVFQAIQEWLAEKGLNPRRVRLV
ncbi:MAG: hypothetical protein DRH11_09495 [Deltaproteobacteria bacterium]|nr:MAG: hypothetical protein DRH11_09495 [Deltaproteobacteria bacterium]